ncbi:hypothetical protein E6W36_14675 [Hankyongella ginsenosidimutans]|uniref:Uncharacterized protein n=2 Tax=Hankyongella ginsenosidimutans TaxID=1763828 RepID=A0A4D7CAD1_9SPHN|nr:hypothetical protein E6W36_14675 [Hankyongella ginsenosidimutans]
MTQQLHALLALIDQIVSLTELEEQRLESERAGSLNDLIREKPGSPANCNSASNLCAAARSNCATRIPHCESRSWCALVNSSSGSWKTAAAFCGAKVSEGLLSAIASEQQRTQMPSPVYNGRAVVTPNAVKPPAASIALNAVV